MPRVLLLALAALAALVLVACGAGDPDPGPRVTPPAGVKAPGAVGASEGRLDLLAPPGYTDTGDFEARTGCDVRVTSVASSDELVRRLSGGRYDGGLGTGDATVRLITAGSIAPVNTGLIGNYRDVYEGLKQQPYNSVGGQMFAVPVGRAANLLLWRRDKIPGTLGSLGAVLDQAQAASIGGQITVPDDPASIGEAALWVAAQRVDLEITDPYELDRRQFAAVVGVLRHQKPYVSRYWRDPDEVSAAFRAGRVIVAMGPQSTAEELMQRPPARGPIEAILPREGSTGISPAWMVAAEAPHPNCMYRWLDHALDPAVNARLAESVGLAPANRRACDELERMGDGDHCELFHADEDDYYDDVLFRTTPSSDCGDERGRVCMDWEAWVRAWDAIKTA